VLMQAGYPWHEAAAMAGVHIGRSADYQLLCNVRLRGNAALQGYLTRKLLQAAKE
jgi:hypothetical protein